ncbi:hypothetical protein [Rubritalea tangerina]|uniref:hypothetical protein n=1 Tax=Rubritalea tangerina TaxID=430798 RepID=UPI00361D1A30
MGLLKKCGGVTHFLSCCIIHKAEADARKNVEAEVGGSQKLVWGQISPQHH